MKGTAAVLGIIFAVSVSGCGSSPEPRFFILNTVPAEEAAPTVTGRPLLVDDVKIPEYLDRPEMVRHGQSNRIQVSNVNRWAGPLGPMIRDVLVRDLAERLPKDLMPVSSHFGKASAARVLTVRINEFTSDESGDVTLDVAWSVVGRKGNTEIEKRQVIEVETGSASAEAQASGMSRALAKLADRIVAALVRHAG